MARDRVPSAEFVAGDATRLPFADGEFDAAVSVFGVIFAQPADAAAAEIARVVRPGGRVVLTTWPPRGPVFAAVVLMRAAIARVRPPDRPPPVNWGDPQVLGRLFDGLGELRVTEHELPHDDTSPEVLWDRWERLHPMWIGARGLLEPAGEWDALRNASIGALREHGFGDGAASPYLLAVLDR